MADETLRGRARAGLLTVSDLLRAGRLRAHYVALAAALGDPEALASGVSPSSAGPQWREWRETELDEATWRLFTVDCAERALEFFETDTGEAFDSDLYLALTVERRRIQDGAPPPEQPELHARAQRALVALENRRQGHQGKARYYAAVAAYLASNPRRAPHPETEMSTQHRPTAAARFSASYRGALPARFTTELQTERWDLERDWQDRHLGRVLISPDWPDWRTTTLLR